MEERHVGLNRGINKMGSLSVANGFATTFQSCLDFNRSEPSTPRSGMNGTPFSVAWSAVWTAGQVASRTTISPFSAASVKRGASPASPSVTALVSISATQPAPMRRSAHNPSCGTPRSLQPFRVAPDQRAHDLHRHQRVVRRQADQRLVVNLKADRRVRVSRRSPDGEAVDLERRLPDAHRHALALLAAGADAAVEREVVADHADARQRVGAVADQRRALHRVRHLAVLDHVASAGGKDELAVGDVDLAAAKVRRIEALLRRCDDLRSGRASPATCTYWSCAAS
jgi:hypothetical protein